MKTRSYLFLITQRGIMFKKRPAGDKIVENLDYEVIKVSDHLRRI